MSNDPRVVTGELARLLFSIGWSSPCDAQWDRLQGALDEIREIVERPTPATTTTPK